MKKVFVLVMSLILGVMVIVIRVLQKNNNTGYLNQTKENWITGILLLMTWGTPFFILPGAGNNKKKR